MNSNVAFRLPMTVRLTVSASAAVSGTSTSNVRLRLPEFSWTLPISPVESRTLASQPSKLATLNSITSGSSRILTVKGKLAVSPGETPLLSTEAVSLRFWRRTISPIFTGSFSSSKKNPAGPMIPICSLKYPSFSKWIVY